MATWDNARGSSASERADIDALFAAEYARLQQTCGTLASGALDRAAYFRVKTTNAFTGSDRTMAIVHMAAHMLEDAPANGQNARAGGPLQAKSNERGSASYATIPVGTYFGVPAHLLQGTMGGRNLLAMMASSTSIMPCVR